MRQKSTTTTKVPSAYSLLDSWTMAMIEDEERRSRLDRMANSQDIGFYFQRGNDVFAGPEASRLTFARMKSPDEPDKAWARDATFVAVNLGDAAKGEVKEHLFGNGDLSGIKVLDKSDAYRKVDG